MNDIDSDRLEQIEETPMGDDDIRTYFPAARIMVYNKLNKIDSIHQYLPNNKSYLFMLIEDSPNKGHWVCMNKLNNVIEFFDSYGGAPDSQLKWMGQENNQMLGQGHKKLTELLKSSGCKVTYNPVPYQEENQDIKTCGRHCCLRIKQMLKGHDLDKYNKFMDDNKKSSGMNYDEIVSYFIQR
jgi:hypothetical protein